jgi:hypothetical protein
VASQAAAPTPLYGASLGEVSLYIMVGVLSVSTQLSCMILEGFTWDYVVFLVYFRYRWRARVTARRSVSICLIT